MLIRQVNRNLSEGVNWHLQHLVCYFRSRLRPETHHPLCWPTPDMQWFTAPFRHTGHHSWYVGSGILSFYRGRSEEPHKNTVVAFPYTSHTDSQQQEEMDDFVVQCMGKKPTWNKWILTNILLRKVLIVLLHVL